MISSAALGQWAEACRAEFRTEHENDAFQKFVLLANILGYKRVAYGLELPTSVMEPAFSFYSNFAEDWKEKFVKRNVRHHGSRVAQGKRTEDTAEQEIAYYWSRSDFHREIYANAIKLDFSETIPGEAGSTALVGLADCDEPASPEHQAATRILVDIAVDVLGRLLMQKHLPQAFITLTENERRYLLWVLEGKTASEIAIIMDLQVSQVETMQKRLPSRFAKKGAFATAFLAFRLGMLDRDEL